LINGCHEQASVFGECFYIVLISFVSQILLAPSSSLRPSHRVLFPDHHRHCAMEEASAPSPTDASFVEEDALVPSRTEIPASPDLLLLKPASPEGTAPEEVSKAVNTPEPFVEEDVVVDTESDEKSESTPEPAVETEVAPEPALEEEDVVEETESEDKAAE
jgi:hypothetical protein